MSLPAFTLVQYTSSQATAGAGTPTAAVVGVLADGKVHQLPDAFADRSLLALLDDWASVEPSLRALATADLTVVPDADLLAPLTYPRKVLCAGANYYSHTEEMGTERPSPDAEPYFFFKPPTTTVVGPDAEVAIASPEDGWNVDWEVELAVVIGRAGQDIPPDEALGHVAGYTIANDLSARGLFHRQGAVFPAFEWDWVSHKALDGFLPLGPGVLPHWFVEDPQRLGLRLSVNGVVKQESSTADMVVSIARQISAASRIVRLEPGDVILTGTPAGVGFPRQEWLAPGDVVLAEIHGMGRLETRMVQR